MANDFEFKRSFRKRYRLICNGFYDVPEVIIGRVTYFGAILFFAVSDEGKVVNHPYEGMPTEGYIGLWLPERALELNEETNTIEATMYELDKNQHAWLEFWHKTTISDNEARELFGLDTNTNEE